MQTFKVLLLCVASLGMFSCGNMPEVTEEENNYDHGGGEVFKVPVPKGYDWEVTQSWASHCEMCDEKYPESDGSFCNSSHTGNCCKFGWDFNLPGNLDSGKPVLASASGVVENVTSGDGWGNTVIINHGNGVCTRYSHMKSGSITVEKNDDVCQGLVIGEIGNTGNSSGPHLHFQFEDCETHKPLERMFTDGNGIPECTIGDDVFDENGDYNFLILSNDLLYNCEDSDSGNPNLGNGWVFSSCGTFDMCPLGPNCGRNYGSGLKDINSMDIRTRQAVEYLWSECAVDGKSDGKYHHSDSITRAEALKVPMYLYGLMQDCGENEPFSDVNQDDWFYTVVACASEKDLISANPNFRPNDQVTFAEAAKILVESAAYAEVIEMKFPIVGNFPHIQNSHWAYQYVETLLYYGGINDPREYYPDQEVSRGEFAVMVASLSPCFCGNIVCEDGCECSQKNFACMDPDDNSSGTGGEIPEDDDMNSGIQISCNHLSDHNRCEGTSTFLYVRCDLTNNTSEDIRVNDLVMNPVYIGECEITDNTDHSGVGVQKIPSETTDTLNGHYEILCATLPPSIEVSFDLKEREAGEISWQYNVTTTVISTAGAPSCVETEPTEDPGDTSDPSDPDDPPTPWICDSIIGYTIYLNTNGIPIEIASSGSTFDTSSFNMLNIVPIHFECNDLPAAILVHEGNQILLVNAVDKSLPPFSVWTNWTGSININPSTPSFTTTKNFPLYEDHGGILIRIPDGV